MESSRIESGADISSDGEREKTKMIQIGIQPLDIRSVIDKVLVSFVTHAHYE